MATGLQQTEIFPMGTRHPLLSQKLKENKLTDKLQIIGPDVAIWSTHESWWTDSCATHLNNEIGLYDIHTYPSKSTVNSGAYTDIIRAYKQSVPADKK